MTTPYTPTAAPLPSSLDLPEDATDPLVVESVNTNTSALADAIALAEDDLDEHEATLRTGYGIFEVQSNTFANNAFYDLTETYATNSPRTEVEALVASVGGGDYISIPQLSASIGLWEISVAIDFAPGTPDTSSIIELIQHTGTDPTAGTIVAYFRSTNNTSGGSVKSVVSSYRFRVPDAVTAHNFSFQVNAGSNQQFNDVSFRRSIYVTQLTREFYF
jgi:hypothetical protein